MRSVALAVALGAIGFLSAGCGGAELRSFRVPSSAMEPTIHCAKPGDGCLGTADDHVLVQAGKPLKRGDIIVFQTPKATVRACGEGGIFLKRIVGLPGETVRQDRRGYIWIRGHNANAWTRLNEPYVSPHARQLDTYQPEHIGHSWHVAANDYFVLGDNRSMSCDSRSWGGVPRANIIGSVVKIIRGS